MFETIKEDIAAIRNRDPAARSSIEIMLLYSGYKAIRAHRRAHWLYNHGFKFLARWVSQRCVRKTNIEIHPAAKIGRRVFIDHGTGVVIGETAVVGDDCTIYQGVTLGGTGKDKGKRHPTLGNGVMVGAGAKVLGPINIGDNTRIAAGAVVLSDTPSDCTAVGVPARIVRIGGERVKNLDQIHVADPVSLELCKLQHRVSELEKLLEDKNKAE
jgi:serine O-acetyltransferase